jgi:hypothetical protein
VRDIESAVLRIGRRIVACRGDCRGVSCDRPAGVLPRCLIWEPAGRKTAGGCAVIGINPGQAKADETEYYQREGATYGAFLRFWKRTIASYPYYRRTRNLLRSLGLNGPILWTELAKCQNEPGKGGSPPLETLRRCSWRFLRHELALVPRWPLIALGREAYRALAYMYPDRTVIGVPHPAGAYGDSFSRHCPGGESHKASRRKVRRALTKPRGQLLWLGQSREQVKSARMD